MSKSGSLVSSEPDDRDSWRLELMLFGLLALLLLILVGSYTGIPESWKQRAMDIINQARTIEAPKPDPIYIEAGEFIANLHPLQDDRMLVATVFLEVEDVSGKKLTEVYRHEWTDRILLTLTDQKYAQVAQPEYREVLQKEILTALVKPTSTGASLPIKGVFFTSFELH